MISKAPKNSKTLWFNGLALAVIVAGSYGFSQFEPGPEVEPLAKGLVALATVALPVLTPIVNMALRFVTDKPLKALWGSKNSR